jgi:hypothetical protein
VPSLQSRTQVYEVGFCPLLHYANKIISNFTHCPELYSAVLDPAGILTLVTFGDMLLGCWVWAGNLGHNVITSYRSIFRTEIRNESLIIDFFLCRICKLRFLGSFFLAWVFLYDYANTTRTKFKQAHVLSLSSTWTYSNILESTWIYLNMLKFIQIYLNVDECMLIYFNVLSCSWVYLIASPLRSWYSVTGSKAE